MRLTSVLASLAVVLLFLGSSDASHCTTWTTSQPEIDSTQYGGWFYLDNDPCQIGFGCIFSVWYYEESNGIPGLQRNDEVVSDTCHGLIESDTIIS